MTCICKVCGKSFEANPLWHHPTGVCSPVCRKIQRNITRANYKKTQKGKASELRWRNNPLKKLIDKRGMKKPTARAKAVIRATRTLANNPNLQEAKRIRDNAFAKTDYGREINKRAGAKYRVTPIGRANLKAAKARRRALEKSAEGSFTAKELIDRFDMLGNKCAHCGATGKLTADHIVPLARGGTNYIDNIQPLCGSCNSRKGARHVG